MNIGILGTGMVGQTLGTKFVSLGHQVKMGSRSATNEKSAEWVKSNGSKASQGTFADAAAFGELVFNCTSGVVSLQALEQAKSENLKGKILIDCSNPLSFSADGQSSLTVCNTDSLAEQIQRAYPDTKVVKTLNTVNCEVMVKPSIVNGDHDLFISGNDADAKAAVSEILKGWLGWKTIIDLGDIRTARCTEMMLPVWMRMYQLFGSPLFNFKIVK